MVGQFELKASQTVTDYVLWRFVSRCGQLCCLAVSWRTAGILRIDSEKFAPNAPLVEEVIESYWDICERCAPATLVENSDQYVRVAKMAMKASPYHRIPSIPKLELMQLGHDFAGNSPLRPKSSQSCSNRSSSTSVQGTCVPVASTKLDIAAHCKIRQRWFEMELPSFSRHNSKRAWDP
jgi:hypothetical protein